MRQERMVEKVADQEKWLPVVGYEGVYSVSNLGNVRRDLKSAGAVVGRILKASEDGWGYRCVSISDGKYRHTRKVASLVCLAFYGTKGKGFVVNHKNGIKKDDRLSNLEYVTQSENVLHAYNVLGHKAVCGSRNGQSKLTEHQAQTALDMYATGGYYQREIGAIFGVDNVTISDIIRRVSWKHLQNPQ